MHMLIGRIRFIRTRIEPWNVTLSSLGCTLQHIKDVTNPKSLIFC